MDEEIREYVQLLYNVKEVEKPLMPKFDLSAYTDNEYLSAISSIQNDFDLIDDFAVTIKFLKGD